MTIVKTPYAILDHPFKAIDPEVGTVITRAAQRLAAARNLKYFGVEVPLVEAYAEWTHVPMQDCPSLESTTHCTGNVFRGIRLGQ